MHAPRGNRATLIAVDDVTNNVADTGANLVHRIDLWHALSAVEQFGGRHLDLGVQCPLAIHRLGPRQNSTHGYDEVQASTAATSQHTDIGAVFEIHAAARRAGVGHRRCLLEHLAGLQQINVGLRNDAVADRVIETLRAADVNQFGPDVLHFGSQIELGADRKRAKVVLQNLQEGQVFTRFGIAVGNDFGLHFRLANRLALVSEFLVNRHVAKSDLTALVLLHFLTNDVSGRPDVSFRHVANLARNKSAATAAAVYLHENAHGLQVGKNLGLRRGCGLDGGLAGKDGVKVDGGRDRR